VAEGLQQSTPFDLGQVDCLESEKKVG
jgi:hypothetical protein